MHVRVPQLYAHAPSAVQEPSRGPECGAVTYPVKRAATVSGEKDRKCSGDPVEYGVTDAVSDAILATVVVRFEGLRDADFAGWMVLGMVMFFLCTLALVLEAKLVLCDELRVCWGILFWFSIWIGVGYA
jgi:hypothetical protein